jgi:hypothetical protein
MRGGEEAMLLLTLTNGGIMAENNSTSRVIGGEEAMLLLTFTTGVVVQGLPFLRIAGDFLDLMVLKVERNSITSSVVMKSAACGSNWPVQNSTSVRLGRT